MSNPTRSKASRKRFARTHHHRNEAAGRIVRRRKIKEKQIKGTVKLVKCKSLRRVKAQMACHNVFDRLWEGPVQTMPRWKAYEYLQRISGFRHISHLNSPQCKFVIERVKSDFPQLFGVRRAKKFAG